MSSELLTVQEAARWAKVSESFLNKARLTGEGPRFVRLGRAVRYRLADLEAWAAAGAADPTSGPLARSPFPESTIRAAVISARDADFAGSYLDPASWDGETRTITARTEVARRKLSVLELRVIFSDLGVTVSNQAAGGL